MPREKNNAKRNGTYSITNDLFCCTSRVIVSPCSLSNFTDQYFPSSNFALDSFNLRMAFVPLIGLGFDPKYKYKKILVSQFFKK